MFESLEGRTLFSAVTATVHKGILKIVGTPQRDRINLAGRSGALTLTINGQWKNLHSHVDSVYFYGGAGSDTLNGMFTAFDYYVEAGSGNDSIYTGTGYDTVLGGRGNDTIADYGAYTSHRTDYQDGGPGDDHLSDGAVMNGGSGHDVADVEGPYESIILGSGLEELYSYDDYDANAYAQELSRLKSDLSTHNGRLRFSYRFDSDEKGIIGPFIRDDGKIGFEVRTRRDYTSPIVPPAVYTLNAHYTKLALLRGVVLSYDRTTGGQPILLPSSS